MKELSIEDKAKAYDELIKRLNKAREDVGGYTFKSVYDEVMSELAESGDEKIRKALLGYFNEQCDMSDWNGVYGYEVVSWLEKQGEKGINGKNREIPFSEQKPNPCGNCGIATNNCQNFPCVIRDGEQKSTDKVEPKFKVGDIIKDTEDGEVFTIRTITKDKYIYTDDSFDWIKDQDEYELVEQKPADKVEPKFKIEKEKWYVCTQTYVLRGKIVVIKGQTYQAEKDNVIKGEDGCLFIDKHDGKASDYFRYWAIQDAKDGDVLAVEPIEDYQYPFVAICKEHGLDFFNSYCFIGFDGKFYEADTGHSTEKIHPATKEQRDQLEKAMTDAGYTFDFEKKELKKIEQKPAWSEEDEEMLENIICDINTARQYVYVKSKCDEETDWLKSLRPKTTWKPSDEQMRELSIVATGKGWFSKEILSGLLEQLKKFRGE